MCAWVIYGYIRLKHAIRYYINHIQISCEKWAVSLPLLDGHIILFTVADPGGTPPGHCHAYIVELFNRFKKALARQNRSSGSKVTVKSLAVKILQKSLSRLLIFKFFLVVYPLIGPLDPLLFYVAYLYEGSWRTGNTGGKFCPHY